MKMSRIMLAMLISLCGSAVFAGAQEQKPPAFVPRDWSMLMPEDPMKSLAVNVCGSCHGLEQIVRLRGDKAFWTDQVWAMVGKGADLQQAEVEGLAKYYSTVFSPDKPELAIPININAAGADMLKLLPPLASHADDIVKARDEVKGFQKPEDLLKVKGITKEDFEKVKPFISTGS